MLWTIIGAGLAFEVGMVVMCMWLALRRRPSRREGE